MFPRMNITNPFQSFPIGVPQYGVGFGGINPLVPYLASPYASNPIAALNGIGVNPYALGPTQFVHPLLVAQLATTNPTLPPAQTQHSSIGQSPYGIWGNPFFQGISPQFQQGWGQQFGGGIGQPGSPLGFHTFPQQAFGFPAIQQGFGYPALQQGLGYPALQQGLGYPALQQGFGLGVPTPINGPVFGVDPNTAALIAQQSSQWTQQLPIRPLITPQQPDPFQMSILNGGIHCSPNAGVPI